jgi:hypothetical protein
MDLTAEFPQMKKQAEFFKKLQKKKKKKTSKIKVKENFQKTTNCFHSATIVY